MPGPLTNISSLSEIEISNAGKFHYAIVVSEWNIEITDKLRDGALKVLASCGVGMEQINTMQVPGAFELPISAKWLIDLAKTDAVICLGCIIKGETKHDQYISNAVSQGIMDLNLSSSKPVIFGVLTVDNIEQAEARAGGIHGNKGEEAAITAIKMLHLRKDMFG